MKALEQLKSFSFKVYNANGQAQIVGYSFWGVLVAGMLWDFCDKCLPEALVAAWGGVSLLVLGMAIWGSKRSQMACLWLDMVLSAVVLSIIATHEPEYVATMVYNVTATGAFEKVEHNVSELSTIVAVVWMMFHSAYLANLTHRQILERKRFHNES